MTGSGRKVHIIGGGLAGSEAALQLADRGWDVTLYEMRPEVASPAHHTGDLAELVCSNSLKSADPDTAAGLLKWELERLGSHLIRIAYENRVPAGGALAVDRSLFAAAVTAAVEVRENIAVVREELTAIPEDGFVIVATGPLTSEGLEPAISSLIGADRLAFFDAAAPIVDATTIDRDLAFAQSRYDKGGTADYLNAPMNREEYEAFMDALLQANRVRAQEFETSDLFQACQPIEEVARTGHDSIRFGALKPVGLTDPRTGGRPWAVVQLRAENAAATAYNLVGFQTNLTWPEQKRVFSMIPALRDAEFLRYGVMHRNTFIDAPRLLDRDLSLRIDPRISFAGQITGTEGYTEAIATGLLAALGVVARAEGLDPLALPDTSALGSLVAYATDPETHPYQPMHVNFGLVPPLPERVKGKRERYAAYSVRARGDFETAIAERDDLLVRQDGETE